MSTELGEFLRARRSDANLESPTRDGNNRRRVTGLRREEVSTAAGISIDYYTRLEQGRETRPSDAVIDALARVLRLTPDATEHLYRLRGASPSSIQAHTTMMAYLPSAWRPWWKQSDPTPHMS